MHAEPLGLVAVREQRILFHESLALDEITTLQIEFGTTMRRLAGELPGWECVGTGQQSGAPRAVLSFDASGPVISVENQTYRLAMSLTVKGLGSREAGTLDLDWGDTEVREVAGTSDPAAALAMLGRSTIEDLMRGFSPCRLTLDLNLEGAAQISDARFVSEYAGVARGECGWTGGSGPATEGSNQPFTTSFGLFNSTALDLAGDATLLMDMENAASMSLPRPTGSNPRVTWWLGSVVLDYAGR